MIALLAAAQPHHETRHVLCVAVFKLDETVTTNEASSPDDNYVTPLLDPLICLRAAFATYLLGPMENDIVAEDPPAATPSDATESAPAALPDGHVAESTSTIQDEPTNPTEATTVEVIGSAVEPVETAVVVETVDTVADDETEAALVVDLDSEVVVTEEKKTAQAGEWPTMF